MTFNCDEPSTYDAVGAMEHNGYHYTFHPDVLVDQMLSSVPIVNGGHWPNCSTSHQKDEGNHRLFLLRVHGRIKWFDLPKILQLPNTEVST